MPVVAITALLTAGCAPQGRGPREPAHAPVMDTTYARLLARARAGDVESQNAVGFMLFFGEGVPRNRLEAHRWFHVAADRGFPRAQRNLAVMHYLGAGVPRDDAEAERFFVLSSAPDRDVEPRQALAREIRAAAGARTVARPGESLYMMLCAGCHGFNGIAEYERSPSFALGERLDKSDAELLRSIEQGIGQMPKWDDKLPRAEIAAVLAFVRTLRHEYEAGIARALRTRPRTYFLFGAMSSRAHERRSRQAEDDVELILRLAPPEPHPSTGAR